MDVFLWVFMFGWGIAVYFLGFSQGKRQEKRDAVTRALARDRLLAYQRDCHLPDDEIPRDEEGRPVDLHKEEDKGDWPQ